MPLTVSARVLGRRTPLSDGFSVPPPPGRADGGPLTLRDLIEAVVRAEVEAYRRRERGRTLDRVMTRDQIDAAAVRGKVAPGARGGRELHADPDRAVATALEAFEDGLYLVILDGEERRRLDEPVYLTDESRMVFVRLTFLAGL